MLIKTNHEYVKRYFFIQEEISGLYLNPNKLFATGRLTLEVIFDIDHANFGPLCCYSTMQEIGILKRFYEHVFC